MLIRAQPADFGWELHEFDPFFNYRATEYIVENGIEKYFQWNDDLSWYPHGRNVSQTSQVMLHLTSATTYWLFGGGSSLYDFTILFPAVIGSLTCIVVFALVRVIGGTTAGLFSTLFFSISIPIIVRGQIGWFKSEPLGLFFGILAVYLFLSGINHKNHKISLIKLVASGIILVSALSSWGGTQFFLIPLGLFFLTLPFLRKDHNFLIWSIPVFTTSTIFSSFAFERLATSFVAGLGGLSLIIPTIFLVICIIIQMKSKNESKIRNSLFFLISFLVISSSLLVINFDNQFLPLPTYRYLNAINPFMITSDPLIDSVAEHATTTIAQSFLFHSVLMIFAAIGIWLLLKNSQRSNMVKKDMISFSLILGLVGVYISSAFIRLEVFASLSIIILSSLGLSFLIGEFFSKKNNIEKTNKIDIKIPFIIGIIILLTIPLIMPENSTIFTVTNAPPTILNGGSNFSTSTNDWDDSLEWIKNNTPKDAVIASWWDYGYWIQTKAERASLADNSTLVDWVIKKIAQTFLNSPEEGWKSLKEMEADYFVIFVTSQRMSVTGPENQSLYLLSGGGDESKKQWFMRIANQPLDKFLHSDRISGTEYFWENTLLGQMIPYDVLGYVNLNTNQQSLTYLPGYTGIYEKNIKFPEDGNGPLKLVYSSPSFNEQKSGPVIGVFVYEINKDFVPLN
jgi:dolichyl-diphosphooligosaccharide--protein glycosyltransferase